jgi:hypothetical protein
MRKLYIIFLIISTIVDYSFGQAPQGFFLNEWKPRTIASPDYTVIEQPVSPVTVSVKVNFTDTVTKVPIYMFGDNHNPYTGFMSNNATLMQDIKNLNMGVLRGPGGSLSDIYFWNRNSAQRPTDIPTRLYGATSDFSPWYGKRPYENWAADIDTFYRILKLTNNTGIITVNYGYARYGTSSKPVAQAAHLAADWVRYDKGRSKFWEIGNETFGSWEAGYNIDLGLNGDNQPFTQTGKLYGQHCKVFIDSMKAAAKKIGVDIKIGAVLVEASSTSASWNSQVYTQVGDSADFYIIHSYFTPYNENSTVETILNSTASVKTYKNYLYTGLTSASKPKIPIALTEWNIFAIGSLQQVSYVDGMHAALVLGEVIEQKYGLACRWDLANGYSSGNDHGLFAYNDDPSMTTYSPRPAFYYMYYFQKYFGDVMVKDTVKGNDVVAYASKFNSGQAGVVLVNKGRTAKTVRLNIQNFKFGNRYYTYTLTGGGDGDFSRKVNVNGYGPTGAAGGPAVYDTIKARSSVIADEIRFTLPALSVMYALVDSGRKELTINEDLNSSKELEVDNYFTLYPNPANRYVVVKNIPRDAQRVDLIDLNGKIIYSWPIGHNTQDDISLDINIPNGIYLLNLITKEQKIAKKLIVDHKE